MSQLQRTGSMSAVTLGLMLLLAVLLAGCGSPAPNPPAGLGGENGIGSPIGGKGAGPTWNTAGVGGAESAIDWAESFMTGGVNASLGSSYHLLCLAFVANAYGAQYAHANSAWDLAKTMVLHDTTDPGKAPRGALMFFDFTSTNYSYRLWGHVGISLGPNPREKASGSIAYGDGTMISALSNVVITSHIKTDTFWGRYYRGWAWPPTSWGPLAQQAPTSAAQSGTGCQVQCPGTGCQVQCPGTGCQVQCPGNTGSGNGAGNTPPPPTVTPAPSPPPTVTPAPPPPMYFESTANGPAWTWTDYWDGGGTEGVEVLSYHTVQVTCRIVGLKTADGNVWWYRLTASPWNNQYYATADAFYNNGQTSGPLQGTPFYDPNVPVC